MELVFFVEGERRRGFCRALRIADEPGLFHDRITGHGASRVQGVQDFGVGFGAVVLRIRLGELVSERDAAGLLHELRYHAIPLDLGESRRVGLAVQHEAASHDPGEPLVVHLPVIGCFRLRGGLLDSEQVLEIEEVVFRSVQVGDEHVSWRGVFVVLGVGNPEDVGGVARPGVAPELRGDGEVDPLNATFIGDASGLPELPVDVITVAAIHDYGRLPWKAV